MWRLEAGGGGDSCMSTVGGEGEGEGEDVFTCLGGTELEGEGEGDQGGG
jgi:hypothetical protein